MSDVLVKVENLTRTFDVSMPWLNRVIERQERQFLRAVDDVSFEIRRGETFALVGESGSGKSTIAKMVVGLLPASSGRIFFDGTQMDLSSSAVMGSLRSRFQMIFQSPYASLNPRWRVRDVIAEPMKAFGTFDSGAGIDRRVDELLDLVGLGASDASKYPHEFSGGQRQRIAIARALSSNPEFIVCDEPTSALDVSVQAEILNLLKKLRREQGLTYLMVTHNLPVVSFLCDRMAVMRHGRVVEIAEVDALKTGRLSDPYSRELYAASGGTLQPA
ncbi:MAG: dipeptide/oligopeptide/nickel ABC transporter ATP-binding protein [Roseitalea porphyridii]